MRKIRKTFSQPIKLEELSWKKLDEFDKEKTIIFLPISPLEEHGPHLPIGTDFLTVKHSAEDAIKILNIEKPELKYILHPSIPIGYCGFNTDFPGSISVSGRIVRDVVCSVGKCLANHGFKYMVICTYHMAIPHLRGIYQAMKKISYKYDMKTVEPWSPYFYNNEVEKKEPKLGFDTSKEVHGGFRETSLMKYLYPYLVDESYKELQSMYRDLSSPRIVGKKFKQLGINLGYIGSPSKADTDYGRWFYNETVSCFVKGAINLFEGKKQRELPSKIKTAMRALFWQ
jgi:creatinine amidohydrolase